MTSQTVSGVTSTYKYDHRGLRLVSFQGSEGQWVYYVFSGDQLIGEVRISGNQKAYTWGADGTISIRDVTSNTSRWLHYGPQGETKYLTNSSGTITDSYNYSAYGVVTSSTGSSYNPFRYGGKVGYYSHGGLILAGQRWYHPGLMRWLSRDPILYDGGDNVYAYVEGNPVGGIDPSGLQDDNDRQCVKVHIWICDRPINGWYGPLLPNHMYVCCDGPNRNCFGHRNNDYKKGNDIDREPITSGECEEKPVCQKTWESKCNNPKSPCDAGTVSWNCRDWAQSTPSTPCPGDDHYPPAR